ncbi:hypothetical protein KIN20_024314 [Parelaphostrongylus tenuis]|uniref:Uncharacterized protein n=1 Tax=Parelaphostrongylus tenuis TaxID=148309 RepID=A0AAD5MY48_PARTN|nr:hypothetical protein KIN20_024314 [Parelaphostrongylus tenuis]
MNVSPDGIATKSLSQTIPSRYKIFELTHTSIKTSLQDHGGKSKVTYENMMKKETKKQEK